MQITNQKRLAAKILTKMTGREVGVHRVWINPAYVDQISSAVQTDDIREFIDEGWIKAKPIKGTSRVRARARLEQKRKGRRKGQGKRSGTANARNPRKNRWMRTIRSQRRVLKDMRKTVQSRSRNTAATTSKQRVDPTVPSPTCALR